ncbi:MAG: fumarate hydratase [Eubacterium sp.]|nr:fumarate hydratase [Eubacterium sp.]SEG19235.1 fumarate hydratase subunit alpha [Eubacterium ruminantium]
MDREVIIEKVKDTLVRAGSTFQPDKKDSYKRNIDKEDNPLSRWCMENILENAEVAEKNCSPLCDDSGIPHIILEVGKNRSISGEFLDALYEGIKEGLKALPGRPMAILGNDVERIEQKNGLSPLSESVLPAPLMVKYVDEPDKLRLTVMMQGGGPEIRAKTYRVFHKHSRQTVVDEIVSWAKEVVGQLGCTPCTLAVGIGRSHFEASSMMLQAMAEGNHNVQNEMEKEITLRVNETMVGPLGLGGKTTVLETFVKIGPQRASGVRIVCLRPCCCFEPRKAFTEF